MGKQTKSDVWGQVITAVAIAAILGVSLLMIAKVATVA